MAPRWSLDTGKGSLMTCVVGYTTDKHCYMAYDAAASDGEATIASITPKAIAHAGNGLIGSAGSWRSINMISTLKSRKCSPQTIVTMLKGMKGEDEAVKETDVLCAWPNRPLVIVQSDLAVIELESPYYAIGSGAAYALGYLEACETIGPEQLIAAVECATKYDMFVSKPVKLLKCSIKKTTSN